MKDRIEAFLTDLDQALAAHAEGAVLDIYPIGRAAFVWQYDYTAMTKDFDVLTTGTAKELLQHAVEEFGKETSKAKEHGLYLETVNEGLPPTPHGYKDRATPVDGLWQVPRVFHLEPHDLAATKLRRFSPKDREDIRLLCDLDHLDAQKLELALGQAFSFALEKDGDPLRDTAFAHLRIVQRYLRGEIDEF